MSRERRLSWDEVTARTRSLLERRGSDLTYWGIPRGGAYVAALLAGMGAKLTTAPQRADLAVDDIIDSGRTAARIRSEFGLETVALYDKPAEGFDEWLVFPWEYELELDAQDTVTRLIQQMGDDPNRDGLRDTPERVVQSWQERFSGYRWDQRRGVAVMTPLDPVVGVRASQVDVVTARRIPFASTCERHLQPFSGRMDIACQLAADQPRGGFDSSNLALLVNAYARRLTLPERLLEQVAEELAQSGFVRAVLARSTTVHYCVPACGGRALGTEHTSEALCLRDAEADPAVESQLRAALR